MTLRCSRPRPWAGATSKVESRRETSPPAISVLARAEIICGSPVSSRFPQHVAELGQTVSHPVGPGETLACTRATIRSLPLDASRKANRGSWAQQGRTLCQEIQDTVEILLGKEVDLDLSSPAATSDLYSSAEMTDELVENGTETAIFLGRRLSPFSFLQQSLYEPFRISNRKALLNDDVTSVELETGIG